YTVRNSSAASDVYKRQIVVDDLPQEVARGVDAQLDRGIEEVMRALAATPAQEPDFGPARPRTREAFGKEIAGS
ncbi:MAG: hypothetical protein QUU85_04080, partial [Candidatus Eisenbacteria bacterium]|nr:hypothetical protein [Candidatus Eisenbacteria bacterium]